MFAANGIWGHYYVVCYSDPASGRGGASCLGSPGTWSGFGGTSVSAPIMAGVQALVNEKTGSTWGNPNPTLYSLAATEYEAAGSSACNSTTVIGNSSGCVFYDVTQGDIDVNCTGSVNCYLDGATNGVLSTSDSAYDKAYGAATGWDFATGIGTVNVYNLVMNWP
jgi:subtilase family serine protease